MIIFPYAFEEKKDFKPDIDIEFDCKIPMPDGINISAKIWKPNLIKKKLPAILTLTPYIADEGNTYGPFFVANDYVFVSADCRGRGNSEGEFFPLENDGADGAAIVQWLAAQPWCDGQVAMMGGSYRGMVQWQTLREFPSALKTIVPVCSVGPGIDFPQPNNIFYSFCLRWLAYVSGKAANRQVFSDATFWAKKAFKMHKEHLPFAQLDELTGSPNEIFRRWLAHPDYDDYWKAMTPSPEDYEKIDIPILTITGYFDDDQPGAMSYYKNHMLYGSKKGKQQHYLLIGPYDHEGTRFPQKELGGLKFGESAVLDMKQLHLEWFDWTLKGCAMPGFLKKKVTYYLMESNVWKYSDNIEEMAGNTKSLYLSSEKANANDVFHSGILSIQIPKKEEPDTISYNPLHIVPEEKYFAQNEAYLTDQSEAYTADTLILQTAPLVQDWEIAGYPLFKAYMQIDVPDMDININLFEIRNDGSAIYLSGDFMRARYHQSLYSPQLINPDEILLYEFKTFYIFARTIKKGSRLRLVIKPLNTPDFQKNYNSGGNVSLETAKDARTSVLKLYHDEKYPSVLMLPVKV